MADRLWDITPTIDARLKVWPQDTPPSREVLLDMRRGDVITLSTLHTTVHLGAHADAPSHYGANAPSIEAAPLERYLGHCEVRQVAQDPGTCIDPSDFGDPPRAPRVLIRTNTYVDPRSFCDDFAGLTPALVDWLAEHGVVLVGIDTPSVDLFESQSLPAHQAFLRRDVAILEGLVLGEVPAGEYELIALPLKLAGFDASPVRAVLRGLA